MVGLITEMEMLLQSWNTIILRLVITYIQLLLMTLKMVMSLILSLFMDTKLFIEEPSLFTNLIQMLAKETNIILH